jgi:signal transduction histidine kinase
LTATPARLWHASLRLRLTVAGTALAAVIFMVGGAVVIILYQQSLTDSVRRTVAHTAGEVAAQITLAGRLPDPIPMPVAPGVPRVQILDSRNRVITGDPASAGQPTIFRLAPGLSRQQVVVHRLSQLDASSAAVCAVRAATPHGPVTVVAALTLDPAAARAREAAEFTAALAAVSLAVVGAVAWLTAGRTLRPVERMRRQATQITASGDLSGRLADPGAGELARLSGTLNEMLESLERSVDRQRRFVADAAHELRTPLAGMTAALEVAHRHPDTSGTLVKDLLSGHRRLSHLVNDLLVLAALDGGAAQRAEPVDLTGVVTDCSRRHVPDGISLCLGHLARVFVLGDESQLSRVVSNLVDNALRYAASMVELAVHTESGQAVITVADDGPGIPVAARERIWERFVRLDDDRSRASGGSGLGLAMVRELTAAHGGTAVAASRDPEPGTVFLVCLPVTQPRRNLVITKSVREAGALPGLTGHPAP